MKILHRRPSASIVVAMTALVVAASGTAVAATSLVNGDKLIKKHSLSGNRLRNHTLTGTQINLNKLGKVPSAKNADHATSATSATTATSAVSATNAVNAVNATTATNATNATNLGGQPASAYAPATSLNRSGLVTIAQGTTARQILVNGPLSFTADCTVTGGVTTVALKQVSTVGNWLSFGSLQTAAGSTNDGNTSDSGSVGSENGNTTRADILGPSGQAIHAQVAYGVNWPSAGECFVDAGGVS
jgi:hypothetical protein